MLSSSRRACEATARPPRIYLRRADGGDRHAAELAWLPTVVHYIDTIEPRLSTSSPNAVIREAIHDDVTEATTKALLAPRSSAISKLDR